MVAIIHALFGVVTRAIRSARYSWVILIFSFRVVTGSHHLSVAGSFRIRDQSNARKKSRKRFLAAIMPSKYGATRTLTIRSTAVLDLAATSFLAVTRVRNRVPRVVGDGLRDSHGACTSKCGRKYTTCCHSCEKPCHNGESCPPCDKPCEVRCNHSRCNRRCHEPCSPCAQQDCRSGCPHTRCTMPCAAPCNWIPCSERCEEKLECGHQCKSTSL